VQNFTSMWFVKICFAVPDRMLSPTDNRLLSTSQQRLHSRRGR